MIVYSEKLSITKDTKFRGKITGTPDPRGNYSIQTTEKADHWINHRKTLTILLRKNVKV